MGRDRVAENVPGEEAVGSRAGHGACVAFFCAFVVLFGMGLNALTGMWHGACSGGRRNPHFRRAWAEHVSSAFPRQPGERLIVIISNSQGYGRELDDAQTYPRLLEGKLAERLNGPVRVLNWSVPAGVGVEYVLLGAAAARLAPDVLMLVAGPGNFDASWLRVDTDPARRAAWPSDNRYLLGFGDVRRRVPREFLSRYIRPIDWVDIMLGRACPVWSYRHLPAAWLMRFRPLHAFERSPEKETWFYGPSRAPARPVLVYPPIAVDWDLVRDYLGATQGMSGTRRVFVSMPLHTRRRGRASGFLARMRADCAAAGVEVWDCAGILPDHQYFVTTHADREGHEVFAEHLARRLAP
ncbi:MAG: hypothetical protein JXR37_17265 [Kiritimatiellae bacterium]|nr:hypothetical protein [Kiritimatiellia bacterium]